VSAGIVNLREQYLYSNARNYSGEKGILEIELNVRPMMPTIFEKKKGSR